MIKALLLILEPVEAWEKVFRAHRGIAWIFLRFLLPLVVLGCLADGYGMHHWGKMQNGVTYMRIFTVPQAVAFQTCQALAIIAVVFILAGMFKALGETFHGRHNYKQTFTVAAYGLSPMLALRVCDMIPAGNQWLSWVFWVTGAALCVAVLYQGIPRIMQPDPPHAFGLYLTSCIIVITLTGMMRLVTTWFVEGRFKALEKFIQHLAPGLSS